MLHRSLLSILCVSIVLLLGLKLEAQLYFPPTDGDTWETVDPVSEYNWCQDSIDAFHEWLERNNSQSFVLLKGGKIVMEGYYNGHDTTDRWIWYSAGKSLRAFLVGLAQQEGLLDIEDKVSDYLGRWTSAPINQEDKILVRHQLSMSTGLNEFFWLCTDPTCLFFQQPAGVRWAYHQGPYNLTKDVLEAASEEDINSFSSSRLFDKIGMSRTDWRVQEEGTFAFSSARDMARFGLLMQADGSWDQEQIMQDTAYLKDMTTPSQDLNESYGYLWWLNGYDSYMVPLDRTVYDGSLMPDAPQDAITAIGFQGQVLSISQEMDMVLVRQGSNATDNLADNNLAGALWQKVIDLDCFTMSTIEDQNILAKAINPNPVDNQINFTEPSSGRIYGLSGSVLAQFQDVSTVTVDQLPSGIYIIELQDNKGILRHKFLKL